MSRLGESLRAARHLVTQVRTKAWRDEGPPSVVPPARKTKPASILLLKTPPWDTRLPPLGVGYLSAFLTSRGYEAPVWDVNIDTYLRFRMDQDALWDMESAVFWFTPDRVSEVFNHECDVVARRVLEAGTDYVGFSLTMEGIHFARLVADRLRRDAPEKILVFGGPGVAFPEFRALFPRGSVDLFVVGPGEEALRLLLEHRIGPTGSAQGALPPGLRIWRDRPSDPDSPLCLSHDVDGDVVVHPTFAGYDLCKYRGRDHIALIMGRGCFRSCAFCSDKPDQGRYRGFPFEGLMRAIADYKERLWIGGVTWNDLILNGDLHLLDRYCDVLLENRVELVWDGQATAHRVMNKRPWLFEKMAKSGCTDLTYGLESFDDAVLHRMKKGYTREIAVETLKRTKEAGIRTGINLICGFPGETEEEFANTLRWIEECRPHIDRVTSLSVCAVIPGSPLWTEAESYGIRKPPPGHYHEWESLDGTNTLPIRLDRHARMQQLVRDLGLMAVVQATDEFDPRQRPSLADDATILR